MNSFDPARAAFQGELDSAPIGGALDLLPCEFPGPFTISHAIALDGHGATFWALRGPVLDVQADRVILRNLRIEVTGDTAHDRPEDGCALRVRARRGLVLENVEVRGSVLGLAEEEGEWRYPSSLLVGNLAHGREHDLLLRLYVPVPCRISSNISGLEPDPVHLKPGPNEVRLHLERLAQDTLLNGTLTLGSAFLKRSILFSAHVVPLTGAPHAGAPPIIWQPPDWATLLAGSPPLPPPPPPSTPVAVPPAAVPPAAPGAVAAPPAPPAAQPAALPTPPAPVSPPPPAPRVSLGGRRRRDKAGLGEVFSPKAATEPPPPVEEPAATAGQPAAAASHDTPPEPVPVPAPLPSRRVKPISPIFNQAAARAGNEDEREPPLKPDAADNAQAAEPRPSRKIVRPGGLGPLFKGRGSADGAGGEDQT